MRHGSSWGVSSARAGSTGRPRSHRRMPWQRIARHRRSDSTGEVSDGADQLGVVAARPVPRTVATNGAPSGAVQRHREAEVLAGLGQAHRRTCRRPGRTARRRSPCRPRPCRRRRCAAGSVPVAVGVVHLGDDAARVPSAAWHQNTDSGLNTCPSARGCVSMRTATAGVDALGRQEAARRSRAGLSRVAEVVARLEPGQAAQRTRDVRQLVEVDQPPARGTGTRCAAGWSDVRDPVR